MLDFKELSIDGRDLELLVREILFRKGFRIFWSGVGQDGGRDLICIENRDSLFFPDEKRWLIQCKHNAHSGKAVGIKELDNVIDSCNQHNCRGYLLVCSTYPSSSVVKRLESITGNAQNLIEATFWDAVKIEQLLSSPRNWPLAQDFFPISTNAENLVVYATESPNHWVVNYKGYYFHLHNRIGSTAEYHFDTIRTRIQEIESIRLPRDHFIRVRAVYYDEKGAGYVWYLDYMFPYNESPVAGTAQISHHLGDGCALEDGQCYEFDVIHRPYSKYSDHHDPDHYSYYDDDSRFFLCGIRRARSRDDHEAEERSKREVAQKIQIEKEK